MPSKSICCPTRQPQSYPLPSTFFCKFFPNPTQLLRVLPQPHPLCMSFTPNPHVHKFYRTLYPPPPPFCTLSYHLPNWKYCHQQSVPVCVHLNPWMKTPSWLHIQCLSPLFSIVVDYLSHLIRGGHNFPIESDSQYFFITWSYFYNTHISMVKAILAHDNAAMHHPTTTLYKLQLTCNPY